MTLLGGVRDYINKKITNGINGAKFNQEAYEEAHAQPFKLQDIDDEDSATAYPTDEEWTNLITDGPRLHDQVNISDEYLVRESPSAIGQLRIKLTSAALEKTCEAANVSKEYAAMAVKYVATEAARDVGWVTSCKTVMDAVVAVKNRFPVLEDMEQAYKQGRKASREERKRRTSGNKTLALDDVALLGDESMRTDIAMHKGKRITMEEVEAEPIDPHEEYEADSESDSEFDEVDGVLYRKKKKE